MRASREVQGGALTEGSYPAGPHDYADANEEMARLEAAMDVAPRGAVVVSGVAVGLLMLAWMYIYIFVFLPRGTVG